MPVSIAPFVGGDVITASSVLKRLDHMEEFVNGGISGSDLKSTAWVKTEHIAKPEFFASADKFGLRNTPSRKSRANRYAVFIPNCLNRKITFAKSFCRTGGRFGLP